MKRSSTSETAAPKRRKGEYISLTTHPGRAIVPIQWGNSDPQQRGPIIGQGEQRNVIGAHGGSYSIYKGLSVATGALSTDHKPDLTNTHPAFEIPPQPTWDDESIVSMDPWGHVPLNTISSSSSELDVRPTIAVTKAHIDILEIKEAIQKGRLVPDEVILKKSGQVIIGKAAVEPVWYLPGIARRMGVPESVLRRSLFQQTNGMYPELMTRTDMSVFLPPIGGLTVYIFGDPKAITDPKRKLTVRVHDECNGSDVFGSDICTCRSYLIHAIEVCVKQAQEGGVGVIVYFRKEGRALGEVTKYLVYNARKRQEHGDQASKYFECTANVVSF